MVEEETLPIIWAPDAWKELQKAYHRIKEESPKNAIKVRDKILEIIDLLPENPIKYPPDRFKRNNTGHYRAFEKYKFRITYKFSEIEIKILRFRHTSRKPIEY